MRWALPALWLGICGLAGCPSTDGFTPEPGDASTDGARSQDGQVPIDGGADATCTANLDNDPKHCGRCFHDCLGGTCAAGACSPVALATSGATPYALAVDASGIYYFSSVGRAGTIMTCTLDGCQGGPQEVARMTQDESGTSLALDDQHIYYTTRGASTAYARSVPKQKGAQGATLASMATPALFQHLTLVGTDLYWFFSDTNTKTAQVLRCAAAGCSARPTVMVNLLNEEMVDAVFGPNEFYYLRYSDYGIFKCPNAAACAGPSLLGTVAEGIVETISLQTEGVMVLPFWTTSGNKAHSALEVCPTAGCTPNPKRLFENQLFIGDIASDATFFYVSLVGTPPDYKDGEILRVSRANPADRVTLAKDQPRPGRIARYDTVLYWINAESAQLMRLAL